jgi:hypothetical protein
MSNTGAALQRPTTSSQLVAHWRSRGPGVDSESGLDMLTGQKASNVAFTSPGNHAPTIEASPSGMFGGFRQPRFQRNPARGNVMRLDVEGEVAGQSVEQYLYDFPLNLQELTVLWRVWPVFAAGLDVGSAQWGLMLGTTTVGGGWLGIRREGVNWVLGRKRGATEIISQLPSTGDVYPVDLLATLATGGSITLRVRDANGIRNGNTATDANMLIATEIFGNSQMTFCGVQGLVAPGGRWHYELVKIARGVKTHADVDKLV